ncbi:hypothetical protein RJ640_022120 [Escallonia rubra]|uniref:Uncharacterized protein n=1 Tax=Escallonia rubra TaxID=112253 RepID=A0AA88S753_9ASTE|nr:hypothetical protein RJ640_022120 [Escallonia rubra]
MEKGLALDQGSPNQSFISGLKDDIRLEVENFDVGDLSRAIFLARKHEASSCKVWHPLRTMTRVQFTPTNTSPAKFQTNSPSWKTKPIQANPLAFHSQQTQTLPQKALLPTPNQAPTQRFTRGFFDERRKKGLVEGIKASDPHDTLKLHVNRVLNASGHAGRRLGNRAGVIGLLYAEMESERDGVAQGDE